MIPQKRPLFRASIVRIVDTCISLLRYASAQRKQSQTVQNDALTKLKSSAIAVLQQALKQGHTCLPLNEIIHFLSSRHKGTTQSDAVSAINQLCQCDDIHNRNGVVSLSQSARAEETIAYRLRFIGRRLRRIDPQQLANLIGIEGSQLSDEQRAAVLSLASSPVAILTGDPGTGKTVAVRVLTAALEKAGYVVYLTAPTGRAAARLAEATGKPALTLHRLLHNNHRQQSLRELIVPRMKEVIIVDEASMLDLFLAERLVEYCTSRTKLILVGDVHQLPPVGPGQMFRDLLESGQIPAIELTNCFRQADQSAITAAAKQIKSGITPELIAPGQSKSDCYFIEANSLFDIQRIIVNVATRSLPKKCGADPHRDIQVLAPMHRGPLGTIALNKLIRVALNQETSKANISTQTSELDFQTDDRILQTKNNYDLGVFNGECGIVEKVTNETVTVSFGDRCVTYDKNSLENLTPGYAITIHRSQGSEYPFVIIPIHESQGIMLTRELLYTALARGKQMVVLIGSRRAFARAISNNRSNRRTGLKDLLSSSTTVPTTKRVA